MRKDLLCAVFAFCVIFLSACVSTKIASVQNPQIELSNYNGFLIYADIPDLIFRTQFESDLKKQLTKIGKRSEKSVDLIPPVKEYDDLEIKSICAQNNIDAIIKVSVIYSSASNGSESVFYAPGTVLGIAASSAKTMISFNLVIYDSQSDETIILGTANCETDDYYISDCMENIAESLAKEITKTFFQKTKESPRATENTDSSATKETGKDSFELRNKTANEIVFPAE